MTQMDSSHRLASAGPGLQAGDSPPLLFVLKFRLRDKHARELNRQARAVNFVWNYANETQQKDERLTSQVCSACGALPEGRPRGIADLAIRRWDCSECGAVHDRDVNAAINIVRLGQQSLAEGALV